MRSFLNQRIWTYWGLLVLLTSCVSMGRISIQVSVPPQRAISNDIQSIVLMNRSMTKEFSNYNQDSLEELFIKKKLSLDNLFLDSLASDTTLKALSNALYQSGRFDVVIPVKRNLQNNDHSFQDKSASLTLPQVKQICNEFNVDAVLMLENFEEKVKTSYQIFAGNMFNGGDNLKEYTAYIQVAYHSNWKLYQPLEKLMAARFEVKDTIYFERRGNTLQATYEELPTIKEALLDGAIENGENLSAYISPGWKSDNRRYFLTSNTEADKAVGMLKKNDWQEAKNIWLKFSNSSSDRFRSMIEFNLALASEMTGDLKEAISWAKKSHQSRYSKAAEDYLRLLNDRLVNN